MTFENDFILTEKDRKKKKKKHQIEGHIMNFASIYNTVMN